MHCIYRSMLKGTYRAEAWSNSEQINLTALAVFELGLSDDISQSVSQ